MDVITCQWRHHFQYKEEEAIINGLVQEIILLIY